MSDATRDLLTHGVAAAKANSKAEARYFLEWLLRDETAEREEQLEAWHWLALLSDDPKEKRNWIEEILSHDPMDAQARRELAILNGQLNPADIVNPDQTPPAAAGSALKPITARRFVCLRCGGRMAFDTYKTSLTCQYCGSRQSLLSAMDSGAMIDEQNFTAALATTKGHSTPATSQVVHCAGCGADFQFSPQMISQSCSYCGTPYVIEQIETRDLIAPDGIIPFKVERNEAQRAVMGWYAKNKFKVLSADALPNGIYLPAWSFDIGGVINWSCVIELNDKWLPESGSALADETHLLIAASHTLRPTLTKELDHFPLDQLVPYDARYLADWAAETYSVEVGDASIVARSRVLAKTQPLIQAGITRKYQHLQFSTLKLVIESYNLVLLPFWLTRYRFEGVWYNVVINGVTSQVLGEKPQRGIGGWFASMMGR